MTRSRVDHLKRTWAAAAALVLFAVMPATAQLPPSAFGLQFQWTDRAEQTYEPLGQPLPMCKTDFQIRQAIAARGYEDIALNVAGDTRIEVRASLEGWTWLLDYDFCRDTILAREPLRPD